MNGATPNRSSADVLSSLDEGQKKAASVTENTVVSAGAGSGKTRVLVKRFVWLITEKKIPVDRIVTLTFTKKAVAEMYSRIYQELSQNVHPLAKKALAEFHTAKIHTLDSYCARIARSCSRLYGISPDFTIDDEGVEQIALDCALPFVLENQNSASLQKLIAENKIRGVAEGIFAKTMISYACISHPLDFEIMLKNQKEEIALQWENVVKTLTELINSLRHYIDEQKKENETIKKIKQALTVSFDENNLIQYAEFLNLLSSVSFRGRTSEDMIPIKEIIAQIKNLYKNTAAPICNFMLQEDTCAEVFSLLERFQRIIIQKKRQAGLLTFSDVARLSLDALIEHPDIRRIEKESCEIIMIDEFQDNNALQRDLLFLLAEKKERMEKSVPSASELCRGKLFFVGDEKQSIYKFRGADVSVFRDLSQSVTHHLQLQTNYRSSPNLIACFNQLFGSCAKPIFLQSKESAPYEATYINALAAQSVCENNAESVAFYFFDKANLPSDDSDVLSSSDIEAAHCAHVIFNSVQRGDYDYCDVAVLFRSLTHQLQYEKFFRTYAIPYTSDSVSSLFSDAPVNDMYMLLRLIVYPKDTNSYASVLKSPLVRMSEEGMRICILNTSAFELNEGEKSFQSAAFSEADMCSFNRGRGLYDRLIEKSKTATIAQLVTSIWYDEGYRYETMWNESVQLYGELYDFFFELARKADERNKTLSNFIDEVYTIICDNERVKDLDIPMQRSSGVHLMSIHKSKGLEFPVVFVCDTGNRGKIQTNSDPFFYNEKYGVSLNLPVARGLSDGVGNYFYNAQKEIEKLKSIAELRRLLYVALTRCERKLYVFGSFGQKPRKRKNTIENEIIEITEAVSDCTIMDRISETVQKKEEKGEDEYLKNSNSFIDLLFPALTSCANPSFTVQEIPLITRRDIRLQQLKTHTAGFENKEQAQEAFKKQLKNAVEIVKPLIENDIRTPSSLHVHTLGEENKVFETPQAYNEKISPADFGSLVHECIESRIKNIPLAIPKTMQSKLTALEVQVYRSEAEHLADGFFSSPLGLLVKSADWREAEFPFISKSFENNNSIYIRGQIDLVCEIAHEIHVIDFKTDTIENPEEHYPQLCAYRKAAADIWHKDVHAWVFYLRSATAYEL